MARSIRKSRMKELPLFAVKDDPSELLREAAKQGIVEYRLENDLRFLQRVEQARKSIRTGRGVRLEDV